MPALLSMQRWPSAAFSPFEASPPTSWMAACYRATRIARSCRALKRPPVLLGHGLSIGAGIAVAGKRERRPCRAFVLLSDGECDEGSVWEAVLSASHMRLDNLVAIVDANGLQGMGPTEEVLRLSPFADKWRAFGWAVREVDGHDIVELERTFASLPFEQGKPGVVIARTVKGNGVSFMENQVAWHYKSPNPVELKTALEQLTDPA